MKRGGKGTAAGAPTTTAAVLLLVAALLVLAASHADAAAAARRLGAADGAFPLPNGCSHGESNQGGECHGHSDVGTTGFRPTP